MPNTHDWPDLGGLMFAARRLVDGLYAGHHASTRHGPGLEFHDYREYAPGDDPSKIDWKLFGRTDRYHLRRHRQHTDQEVYLLLDTTASMDFAPPPNPHTPQAHTPAPVTKLRYAQTLAAAIAFLTIRQGDRVGLGTYADKLIHHTPPAGTWPHLQDLCQTLEHTQAVTTPSDVLAAVKQAHRLLPRRALVVLISDLIDEPTPLFDALSLLRHDRFEVILFQVLTTHELDPTPWDDHSLRLIDPETNQTVTTHPRETRDSYTKLLSQHIAAVHRAATARRIDHSLVTTDQPTAAVLQQYLTHRSRGLT